MIKLEHTGASTWKTELLYKLMIMPMLTLYNAKIIIIACRKVQFRKTDRSQYGEALDLKILYEQETCSNASSLLKQGSYIMLLSYCAALC